MNLAERLREETDSQHIEMRGNELMKTILRGEADHFDIYGLGVFLYSTHQVLENFLNYADDPRIKKAVTEDQIRSHMLEKDLKHVDLDLNYPKLYSFEDMLCSYDSQISILGAFYVLEGAVANGGKLLHSSIKNSLGFDSIYFKGHREQSIEKWEEFKDRLNKLTATLGEADEIVDCVKKTYQHIKDGYEAIKP